MSIPSTKHVLVVKVGTNVLTDTSSEREQLDYASFERLGAQIRHLVESGIGVILVSSGAITAGIVREGKRRRDITNPIELQRYAARGWDTVIQTWKETIGAATISSALLTKRELHDKATRTQALDVIACCISHGDVFLVNENDTISDDEIRFGDNDTLAAELALACQQAGLFASLKLLLLTNKDGLNRQANDDTTLIRTVEHIGDIESFAEHASSEHGRGGMKTKVQAAKITTQAGIDTFIANGRSKDSIERALNKQVGTWFMAEN